jgi:hypothetical protein
MENKKCNGCKNILPVSNFGKEKRAKNGYKPRCKECLNKYNNNFYLNNKDKFKDYGKKYYLKNKDIIIKKVSEYAKNSLIKKEYNKNYYAKKKSKINSQNNERIKCRLKNDLEFRFVRNVRKLIYRLKVEKNSSTEKMLGYSYNDLIIHLKKVPNKNENIDHIIPVSWFIEGTPVNIINALDNLQILDKAKNLSKSNSYCDEIKYTFFKKIEPYLKKTNLTKIKITYENTLQSS